MWVLEMKHDVDRSEVTNKWSELNDKNFDDNYSSTRCQYYTRTDEITGEPTFKFTCDGEYPLCDAHSHYVRGQKVRRAQLNGVNDVQAMCKRDREEWLRENRPQFDEEV